jgi:hypothetical protein
MLFISYNREISRVIDGSESQATNTQHRAETLQIAERLGTPAICNQTQHDSS